MPGQGLAKAKVTPITTTLHRVVRAFLPWTVLAACSVSLAHAQNCQTSGDLEDATRSAITAAGLRYFDLVSKGDAATMRQNAVNSLIPDFSGIEAVLKDHQQDLAGAQTIPKGIFLLETEGAAPIPRAEFYCGVFGKSGQTSSSTIFYLDNLPPGTYAVVILDATSARTRANFSVILQKADADWKLAGLYLKPAQVAGHDSGWFVARAREYKSKGQLYNAWLYYIEARSLISPLPFMSTLATDRLYDESQKVLPADVPAGGKTAALTSGSATYTLIALFPEAVGNDLDLIVKYQIADASNTSLAYQNNLAVIKVLVARYPEVGDAFAAVVARAVDSSGHDYGTLEAMRDIK